MGWFECISSILLILLVVLVVISLIFVIFFYYLDRHQKQHAILRNFPVSGKMRYIPEKVGPEFRQYLFNDDHLGKPFNREDFLHIVLPGKYLGNVIGFDSKRDFDEAGFYIRNAMFTKQVDELHVDAEKLWVAHKMRMS
ncbi:hypothetical protein ACQKMD_05265 [Viridibacillus sp. NPDC096237]|uniref:hypothetical protein n=1 Tax=Viridibacillus sp. NPDC096237 TaxID=3390721 RepID=UPI003D018AC3